MNPVAILIIEDDDDFRSLMVDLFGQAGFAATGAESVEQAQALLSRERYALIVTDLRMPEKNGMELVHWLRREGRTVPIIVISGFLDSEGIRNLIRHGVAGVFTKPINIYSLLQKATELLRQNGDGPGTPVLIPTEPAENLELALPGESAHALDWQHRLRAAASFRGCLLLRAEIGMPLREICQDIVKANPDDDRLIYLTPATFDAEVLGQLLADQDLGPGCCLTLAIEQVDALQDWQQDLLVDVLFGEGSFGAVEADLRVIAILRRNYDPTTAEPQLEENFLKLLESPALVVPSLREMAEDVPALASRIWRTVRPMGRLDESTYPMLQRQSWPGNVMQLRQVLQLAANLTAEPVLRIEQLREAMRQASAQAVGAPDSRLWRRLNLRRSEFTQAAFLLMGGRVDDTARLLDVHPELVRQIISENADEVTTR